jgi:hypothetical protein
MMPPPNMRVQRTRSSPSALRSPLTRHPLGSAAPLVGSMVALFLVLCVGVACATSRPPNWEECRGSPVELGTLHGSWLGFRVVGSDGKPVPGFWWRYNRDLIFHSAWSAWSDAEGTECARFNSCGYAGITDQEEGTYEIEVCPPGHPPLHGYIDLRYSQKGMPVVLVAPSSE